ncbi:hypothetical protein B0H15DRAFT_951394 [Mycena belliarum]|uniref:Uncharacterized protein n=1 Tax=Mycena belliarum TaxID=1033014 RepID=A0AAD6XMJ3_9AGAR|nr:hypothetical protein B0H15DRAFT_951394 [Mycena belliae]
MPTLRHLVAQLANNLRPLGNTAPTRGNAPHGTSASESCAPKGPASAQDGREGAANGHAPSKMDVDVAGGGDDGSLAAPRDSKAAAARDHRSSSSSSAPHASSAPSSSAAARRPSLRIEYLDVAGLDIWRVNLFCSSSVDARAVGTAPVHVDARASALALFRVDVPASADLCVVRIIGIRTRASAEYGSGRWGYAYASMSAGYAYGSASNGASTSNPYTVVESAGGWKTPTARARGKTWQHKPECAKEKLRPPKMRKRWKAPRTGKERARAEDMDLDVDVGIPDAGASLYLSLHAIR